MCQVCLEGVGQKAGSRSWGGTPNSNSMGGIGKTSLAGDMGRGSGMGGPDPLADL